MAVIEVEKKTLRSFSTMDQLSLLAWILSVLRLIFYCTFFLFPRPRVLAVLVLLSMYVLPFNNKIL